jgi:2-amino-4-hydroxy-6-hydroxymethyldihydropteridine diphosphokinase
VEQTDTMTLVMTHCVYLSLGSNIGDREANLSNAVSRLETLGRVLAVSSYYETEPVEVTEQPWFLNCAVEFETNQIPQHLMKSLLQIEREMGRRRVQKKGPRSIDIDILLFDDGIIDSKELTIPHPAMQARRFVLEPLAEIAPEAKHPISEKTIRELLDALPVDQGVRRHET